MRLLFDQNLSPALTLRLADLYPESRHVRDIGLRTAPDGRIWKHALENKVVIVTKDDDFRDMSRRLGAPPKVVWLRLGNCSVDHLDLVLREHADDLHAFEADTNQRILIIE